jgi:serine phosphatase RsbU (regulator of sigma subunit)
LLAPAVAADDRSDTVVLTPQRLDRILALSREWSYHPGDDPAWADPAFDDSSWPLVRPALTEAEAIPGGWPGIGWFRRRVVLDPAVSSPSVGVWMEQIGASELYIDGRLAVRFGTVSADPATERAVIPRVMDAVALEPGAVHLLAVRYSNARGNLAKRGARGFTLWVGDVQTMVAWGVSQVRAYTGLMSGAAGMFGAFALFHLLLFLYRPTLRENLYFAIFTFAMAAALATELWMNAQSDLRAFLTAFNVEMTMAAVMVIAALLLERRVFGRRMDAAFWVVAAVGIATVAWLWAQPALSYSSAIVAFLALGLADMLRLAIGALLRREPDAWVVAVGFAGLTAALAFSVLRNIGVLDVSPWPMFIAGFGILVLSLSVYLTRRVARTERELAQRLVEVEELTARTVEQEVARRVLEADNLRKTAELEEARRLQLAMLPRALPDLPGFDLAVHMATANEVGGDYYDFLRDAGGRWTVVLGDATGHGLHAGMVVGVAKSLLQTAGGNGNLIGLLNRIDAGLATLHERRASMGLVLARLDGDTLRVASAGMPPMLIRRLGSGEVEEVLLPGVPLGTLSDARRLERDVDIAQGDCVLLMSDGIAEVVDAEGEPFGYERVCEAFAAATSLEPDAVVARLLRAADEHRAGAPLSDDLTLLVLRATPATS